MHSNANDLFKYIDKDTIPLDIEGDLPYTREEIQGKITIQ